MQERTIKKTADLGPIPEKRYFTIGEASVLCDVKAHVLRYWEQEFPQLEPCKRRGNRRYYQHKDVELARRIRWLLHEQGYTISGARAILNKENSQPEPPASQKAQVSSPANTQIINELEEVLQILD